MEKVINRCSWVNLNNPLYVKYHDEEWGIESHDSYYLFEMLVLEMNQAGLSWETILNKRENYRKSLDNFDYHKIAQYDAIKIKALMANEGLVRNQRKIDAIINNAKVFIEIEKEYLSFNNYIWHFTNNKIIYHDGSEACNKLSDLISKDLKKRGMSFVGSKIIYSYLEAIGIFNNHEKECYKNVKHS